MYAYVEEFDCMFTLQILTFSHGGYTKQVRKNSSSSKFAYVQNRMFIQSKVNSKYEPLIFIHIHVAKQEL